VDDTRDCLFTKGRACLRSTCCRRPRRGASALGAFLSLSSALYRVTKGVPVPALSPARLRERWRVSHDL